MQEELSKEATIRYMLRLSVSQSAASSALRDDRRGPEPLNRTTQVSSHLRTHPVSTCMYTCMGLKHAACETACLNYSNRSRTTAAVAWGSPLFSSHTCSAGIGFEPRRTSLTSSVGKHCTVHPYYTVRSTVQAFRDVRVYSVQRSKYISKYSLFMYVQSSSPNFSPIR